MVQKIRDMVAKFRACIDRSGGPEACWPWIGKCQTGGYGRFEGGSKLKRRSCLAHRLAWTLKNGPIPKGLNILHSCDNPPCCNPAHLFVGTHRDNMADMTAKGRSTHGDRNGRARLTAAEVLEIRAAWAAGRNQCQIARSFGVTNSQVHLIVTGKSWGHLPGAPTDGFAPPEIRR